MGSPVFDRQVFVKKQQPQKPPSRSPLPGGLVLVLVAALSAFATYRYVNAGGKDPSNPADKARIAELQTKLKTMQTRVDELEKRRHAAAAKQVSKESQPAATTSALTSGMLHAESAPHPATPPVSESRPAANTAARRTTLAAATGTEAMPAPKPASSAAKHPATAVKAQAPASQAPNSKELRNLQGNLAASHEEWQATTDRLGNVVGELDSQRSAIQQTQSGVNYLLERVQRSDISFALRKGSGLEHVGPIGLELDSTSVKGQHYSLRMMVDDKSIVLKDRALNEIVQFYTSRSKYPLRLIVSQIGRNEVSGTLAVPTELRQDMNNTQLRER